jgi:serine/threonine-protein kinase
MEYIQGPTIGSLLLIDGSLPQYLATEYTAQIADALDSAYKERNVIHRDIKPENLMLDRWGKIKVMDFGLARAPGQLQITLAKTLVGSIYYASPEQVWGQTLDNRSDIYALGVVLYEMVTGHRPFTGRTLPELTQAIVGGTPRPPGTYNPETSNELEKFILKAMARNRDERYENAGLMAQDLRSLNLRSKQDAATRNPKITASANQRSSHEGISIHPPKRPQAQRPRYLDLEATQPPPAESSDHSSGAPALEQSPKQGTVIDKDYEDEVPTKPLGPILDLDTLAQHKLEQAQPSTKTNTETKRTLWKQLQRIFKQS